MRQVRTRWGTVSLGCAFWGVVLVLVGFLMGVGMVDPETPAEEETFAELMNVVRTLLLVGFLLQFLALAVGLVGRWRLGPDERDQSLGKALWISGSVIAVGMLFIASVA